MSAPRTLARTSAPTLAPALATIERVVISRLNIAAKHKVTTPIGVIDGARNVVVRLDTSAGLVGWGEASPFAPITGTTQGASFEAAKFLAGLVKGKDALAIDGRMAEIDKAIAGDAPIRAAFDMALHDIAAKAAGMPLYRFLGGAPRALSTDLTIGHQDTADETAARVREALDAGFRALKIKVGRPGLQDVAHVEAARTAAGADVSITIDSNQGWDLATAVANIRAMAPFGLRYSEQPLARWDVEGLAQLRRAVDLPICADESLFDHRDAMRLVRAGAADILNIKLGKAGGLHVGQKIIAVAEAAGLSCMIGCFAESRLGLTAAAHLAMARPSIAHVDLDAPFVFSGDPVLGGLTYDVAAGGVITLPEAPGLGAEIAEEALEAFIEL